MNTPTKSLRRALHVDSDEVQDAVRRAVNAATESLDETFPGGDRDGINSNFSGLLEKALLSMLTGVDPLRTSRTSTNLNTLVYDDAHFGDPYSRGKMFAVIQRGPGEWDEATRRNVPTFRALDHSGNRFVSLSRGEEIDPNTTFAGAVREAVKWLDRNGATLGEAMISVQAVEFDGDGYKLAAARGVQS
jgi:hypothetical protein